MLHRNSRTGGYDSPGVESSDVPLIGYRPLSPDGGTPSVENVDILQGESSPMKTTWYCPSDLSTVVEEEEEGIIYTVVVKQQHGSPTSPVSTVSRSQCVKAGTEEKSVLHLSHSFSLGDSSFVSIFLSTYRSFTSTERVSDILMGRLEHPPGDSERSSTRQSFNKAVCTVFSTWLSEYPEDFSKLGDPSRSSRLAPLLPQDSSSAADLRARLLRTAEELSEKASLPDNHRDQTSSSSSPPDPSKFEATSVSGFPRALIAEQLTKIETELFVRSVPYHCLGSSWSQRDKKGREGVCWSVRATIRQFNKLANAVLASCLWSTKSRSQQRARSSEKWISVAEECRARKNFSSSYAIVSASQSNPIHRSRRTWQEADREALRRYEESAEIFSDKDNYAQSRELSKEEGTSKFANLDNRLNNRHHNRSNAQGTVPYSGIFLTDLTMLDTAVKDRSDNGYINFDKRRREFEVLAQIRLLQSSCKNCVFVADETFLQWYHSVPTSTEEQSYRSSNEIEAPSEPSPRALMPTVIITQCPDSSSSRTSSAGDGDSLFDFHSPVNNFLSKLTKHMRSPSVSCSDVDTSPPTNESTPVASTPTTPTKSHRRSASCGNNLPSNVPGSGPDMRIIRIRMDLQDGNLYRSISVQTEKPFSSNFTSAVSASSVNHSRHAAFKAVPPVCADPRNDSHQSRSSRAAVSLVDIKSSRCLSCSPLPTQVTSNDKTPAVISSALEKHNQDPKQASRYESIQLSPEGKELVIPATGNVFYAMTSSSVDFSLRRKGGNTPVGSQPIATETSATFPRIKAKGRRSVRTLF